MTHLKVGDKAPFFQGNIETGEAVSLDTYKGKKLVLFFYPKDNTPTCTVEACNLRDNYSAFTSAGYDVLGVSPDSEKKHVNFISKYKLPYHLLADVEQDTLKAYGVWGPKKFMGRSYVGVHRTTFVIDEKGNIEQIIDKVKAKEHTNQILSQ
jgi:peroxiredoxin Q/BCP